ncbi:MAG: hypothetical protein K0S32_2691 [Bacteroidetes bacterium]|jgi:hypothetical protein|nr:hypothetical protein [Bacteroidota bacterium]
MIKELSIFDEDGFIALVNSEKYLSFVNEDWEFEQLMEHFVSEMNKQSFVIWSTNSQGGWWRVRFTDKPSSEKSYQEFTHNISVTNGKLYLTCYTDLTMAAQFEDNKIPADDNDSLFIEIPNGDYSVMVRQLFHPEDYDYTSKDNTYEVVLLPGKNITSVAKVFWTPY